MKFKALVKFQFENRLGEFKNDGVYLHVSAKESLFDSAKSALREYHAIHNPKIIDVEILGVLEE